MRNPHDIIVKALITEKGTRMREGGNKFLFEVSSDANKIEIKYAIEQIFSVHVEEVRTQMVMGKIKRLGRNQGRRPNWKKAIITLAQGENIDLFEQV
ncbi:MAG: 50S ribosomal protein L23 [Candidatus Eisenbacteria bacterium]|uniref:Large ribosomal subunit protein uL23 n=1 Tax=Eiseniibacteriota bacterium TaxID=2212470 RepID=A0A7Y2EBI1_UNCEI|nr:50S ribosomal protein L23 [Candidatus Eisenbacteria bacterium]